MLWLGVIVEKNWAHSVDQCQLQALQFSMHFISSQSVLIRWFDQDSETCSGSDRQQTPRQWPWPFFGTSLALGSALELLLSPATELVVTSCHIKSTILSPVTIWEMVHCHTELEKTTLQNNIFFDFQSAHQAPTCWDFSLFLFASNAGWPWNGQHWFLQEHLMYL